MSVSPQKVYNCNAASTLPPITRKLEIIKNTSHLIPQFICNLGRISLVEEETHLSEIRSTESEYGKGEFNPDG